MTGRELAEKILALGNPDLPLKVYTPNDEYPYLTSPKNVEEGISTFEGGGVIVVMMANFVSFFFKDIFWN